MIGFKEPLLLLFLDTYTAVLYLSLHQDTVILVFKIHR